MCSDSIGTFTLDLPESVHVSFPAQLSYYSMDIYRYVGIHRNNFTAAQKQANHSHPGAS